MPIAATAAATTMAATTMAATTMAATTTKARKGRTAFALSQARAAAAATSRPRQYGGLVDKKWMATC